MFAVRPTRNMWPTFEQLVNLAVKWLILNLKMEAYFRNNNGNFLLIACFFYIFREIKTEE